MRQDPQAQLVYQAEWATSYHKSSFKYRDVLDMHLRLNEIRNSHAYKHALGYDNPVELVLSDEQCSLAGRFYYDYYGARLKIVLYSGYECNDATFLHEFCHYLNVCKNGSLVQQHGYQFARFELGIMRCFVGKEAYEELLYQFDIRKVKH